MVFSSLGFLFIFLPVTLVLYFLAPKRAKNAVLLALSLVFYAWGEPSYIILMIFTALFDYSAGILLGGSEGKKRRVILAFAVAVNLLLLGFFKYYPPLTDALSFLPRVDVRLPIGISFYTFQAMSYVIDVYRRDALPQRNIIGFGLYIALFPQLVAGPIVRYRDIEDQLGDRHVTLADAVAGSSIFCAGLAKKVLIGNTAGAFFAYVRDMPTDIRSASLAWVGLACYSFQIYFDFSGYSDMAIGLGRLFGFRFPQNFDYPYTAIGATDFWRRWHITLSSWFREYLYIPLGGNRRGRARTYLNLFIVWTLTGLWHGAGVNFILWGVYWFLMILADKAFAGRLLDRLPRFFAHVITLTAIGFGWLIFAFDGSEASLTFSAMLGYSGNLFGSAGVASAADVYDLLRCLPLLTVAAIGSTALPIRLFYRFLGKVRPRLSETAAAVLTVVSFAVSVIFITASDYNPFLYFRF